MSKFKVPEFRAIRKETKDWYTPCDIIGGNVECVSDYYKVDAETLEMQVNGEWYTMDDIKKAILSLESKRKIEKQVKDGIVCDHRHKECECDENGTNCARYVFEFNSEDSDEYCTKGHDINKCCDNHCKDFRDISE